MVNLNSPYIESLLEFEKQLKSTRLPKDLNKEGQFFTPYELARQITLFTLNTINPEEKIKYLEPAFGNGSFYNCLLEIVEKESINHAVGIEKDKEIYSFAKHAWSKEKVSLINSDFTSIGLEHIGKFNLLITNPPYVRHQHLTAKDKKELKSKVKAETHINISGYAGLYVYFILLADKFLEEGATATWLIPAEFMSVKYGDALRKYLTENVELQQIHLFDSETSNFDNALVSSAVITYKKRIPQNNYYVNLSFGQDILAADAVQVPIGKLKNGEKWINIIKSKSTIHENETPKLGDFFNIRRGIATGNNDLFIVDKENIVELGLTKGFYEYIIPSSKYLKSNVIEADETGKPLVEPCKILINTDLSMEDLKIVVPRLYAYFLLAEENGENNGYLLKKRNPWYKQESREPAPFICTYMGRAKKQGGKPFNIYKNLSKAIVTNNYLMMYPKEPLREIIKENPKAIDEIFTILSNLNQEHYLNYGREYGGGLKKVEPKELSNIPVPDLAVYVSNKGISYLNTQQSLF
ncbi:Eco57I restriction-modification methylase domain-containing protein [Bacillus thuringiensis]|uniref:Eco57I restriction-modification methylase domain-containing protein n=1 Tax=Bacillus thuringiensis TaxID=1428 RepID=UPI0010218DAC|nr:Eco57I restriction-modification methylase domain-containing protein [Bacillus thuringiensis]